AERPEHVPGARAERPPRLRLRGGESRARGLPPRAPAALAGRRLQDRRRLPERRSAAGRLLRGTRGDARCPPPRLPAAACRRAVGSLHWRHHRVRPAAPLLLEPVRGPGRAAPRPLPRLLPPSRRPAGRARRGAARGHAALHRRRPRPHPHPSRVLSERLAPRRGPPPLHKRALAKREVFGRSALTGMRTYADSLFFMNRPGVPADGLDIIDLAPTILALLGVEPPPSMDGRVRLPP